MSRHDDLTALTYGEPPHIDHLAFLDIFDLGAEEGLPVMFHHNITAQNNEEVLYLDELKRAVAHNPECKIIWAHKGHAWMRWPRASCHLRDGCTGGAPSGKAPACCANVVRTAYAPLCATVSAICSMMGSSAPSTSYCSIFPASTSVANCGSMGRVA